MKNYYTYAYLREDGTPYYVGKGKGRRWKKKSHSVAVPPKERVLFLKEHLSEEEAFKHERYIISILGRKDLGTGILRNRTDGGEGASGSIPWNRGITHSEETRAKLREAHRTGNRIYNNRKLSEETKQKLREARAKQRMLNGKTIVWNNKEYPSVASAWEAVKDTMTISKRTFYRRFK